MTEKKEEIKEVKEEVKKEDEAKTINPLLQYVVIKLADGRVGTFAGRPLLSEGELALSPPRISAINFSAPRRLEGLTPEKLAAALKDNKEKKDVQKQDTTEKS